MKNLLMLPLLLLLTSCVTYYTPETAMEDGIYYAEDDPAYVVFQDGYPSGRYYPWASLDYFYMGYYPYSFYPYYHRYHFGLPYAYMYPYGFWGHYHGYCAHDRVCGGRYYDNHRNNGRNRYAGNETGDSGDRDAGDAGDVGDVGDEGFTDREQDALEPTGGLGPSYNRYVSTMPSGYGGSRGMVIGRNGATKITQSKVQPVASSGSSSGIVVTAAPPASARSSVGTSVVSERPAQTNISSSPSRSSNSSRPSRSSNSSARSRARASSGSSNRSRSSGRSSGSRSTKSSPPVQRENRD